MVSTLILLSGRSLVSFAEPEPAVAPADLALYEVAQQGVGEYAAARPFVWPLCARCTGCGPSG